jgi:hypothetical protein
MDPVIEVRSDEECWRVRARRISAWYFELFASGRAPKTRGALY